MGPTGRSCKAACIFLFDPSAYSLYGGEGHSFSVYPRAAAGSDGQGHRVVLLFFQRGASSGPWVGLRGAEAWLPGSLSSEPGLTLGVHCAHWQ